MKEIFKEIEGYEGLYEVSNLGNIRSLRKNIILKPALNQGYLQVNLVKDGITKVFLVHRLVAQAFIPNPNNLPLVNHKDYVKDNNNVENLEWCDSKYNNNYGTRNQRLRISMYKKYHKSDYIENKDKVIFLFGTDGYYRINSKVYNSRNQELIPDSSGRYKLKVYNGKYITYRAPGEYNKPSRKDISTLNSIPGFSDYYYTDSNVYNKNGKLLKPNNNSYYLKNDYGEWKRVKLNKIVR